MQREDDISDFEKQNQPEVDVQEPSPEDDIAPPPNPWMLDQQLEPPPPPLPFGIGDPDVEHNPLGGLDEQGNPVPHFPQFHQGSTFPGDYYAANDMDVTRGVDPVCVMQDSDIGVPPPFMADYHGMGASFLQDRGFDYYGGKDKFAVGLESYTSNAHNQLAQAVQGPTISIRFQKGTEPRVPPASQHFSVRSTSIYAKAEGYLVGNLLLAYLSRDYVTFDLKVKPAKFTIKSDVLAHGGTDVLTIKIRIYKLPDCVCCEFQRQAGDCFEFGAFYRNAAKLLEVQKFPAARSLEQLEANIPTNQQAIEAAQALMTSSILQTDDKNDFEPLLHQATSENPTSRAEAARTLADLAQQLNKDQMGELLQQLVTPSDETGVSPLLMLLGARANSIGPGAAGYSEACLIEALFREPACVEMLWKSPQAFEAWQGILCPFNANSGEISTAGLTRLSAAVKDICVVLAALVEGQTAEQIREQLRQCLDNSGHRGEHVRCNLEEAILQMPSSGRVY